MKKEEENGKKPEYINYSEEEQLIENTLGNLEPKEEVDERLHYLEMVRELFENNPKEYKRIKNLPPKSRVGRLAKVKAKEAQETKETKEIKPTEKPEEEILPAEQPKTEDLKKEEED